MPQPLQIILSEPRGFCAGVDRAITIVERALQKYGAPVYIRHEIVHNKHVVKRLEAKGAVFVDELDEIPDGAHTIFSAHGVAKSVENEAQRRGLPYIDATCPLVTKVHNAGQRHARSGAEVVLIGHAGHPEVEGTQGRIDGGVLLVSSREDVAGLSAKDPDNLAFVTQTTLSVDDTRDIIDALRERFPNIQGPDTNDICYATQNRQQAVRQSVAHADLLIVIGGKTSSNSNRLREIGTEKNIPSYLIDDTGAFDPAWLEGVNTVAVSAGASAPEDLVQDLIAHLGTLRDVTVTTQDGIHEDMHFNLPRQLRDEA